MSIAQTYHSQTCTITTPGTPTVADNGATSTGGGTVTTTFRGNLAQRSYYRPDGKVVVGVGPITVPASVTVPANGTVTVGGQVFGILRTYPRRGLGGVVIEQVIELGPPA